MQSHLDHDIELLQELQRWPLTRKTLEAERDFLAAYSETHGFRRDQRRLATLDYLLAQVNH